MSQAVAVELDSEELRRLRRQHPELRSDEHPAWIIQFPDGATRQAIHRFLTEPGAPRSEAEAESERRLARGIEALLPDELPTPAAVLHMRRNALARRALIEEFGLLTSAEVAELAGSTATNRAALAASWKKDGRLFTVPYRGQQLFPAFQLGADGRPRAVIREVVEALGGDGGWPTALWFLVATGWLEDRRPVDLLDSDPERIVVAARSDEEAVF